MPVNINHHYTPREVAELLDYVKPRAVIYHRSLGAKFADVLPPESAELLDLGRRRQRRTGTSRRGHAGRRAGTGGSGPQDRRVARRPDHVLHGRHDRPAQGRAVAAERHPTCRRWWGPTTVPPPRSTTRCAQRGRTVVRGLAADARGRPVDRVLRRAGRTAGGAVRRPEKFDPPAVWQTAEREKVGLMTMVGDAYAAPLVEELNRNSLRVVVALRHRDWRRRNQSQASACAAGVAAAAHHHQRLWLLGDRQHGIRPQPAWQASRHVHAPGGGTGALRGLHEVPGSRRDGGRLGGSRQAEFRWATSTMPMPPGRPSRRCRVGAW